LSKFQPVFSTNSSQPRTFDGIDTETKSARTKGPQQHYGHVEKDRPAALNDCFNAAVSIQAMRRNARVRARSANTKEAAMAGRSHDTSDYEAIRRADEHRSRGSSPLKGTDMISDTVGRVTEHTSEDVNQRIEDRTRQRISAMAHDPIKARLEELDREWDIERCVETGSSALTITGLLLGTTVSKRWFLLSAVVQGFFMQHALQGWCPPVPVLRRLGVRTAQEIEAERCALKALRGDFKNVSPERPDSAWEAVTSR
jgi:hypothetical protein